MKFTMIVAASIAALSLAGCGEYTPTSDQQASAEQAQVTSEAQQQVGLPRVANFTEKKLATKIMEMRDNPNLLTYAYLQGMDGKLRCFGKGVGFGIPYSTQISNPQRVLRASEYPGTGPGGTIAQAEPNGLFMPAGADATWYMLIDPKTKQATPTYVEPHLTVSTFPLTGPSVAEPCQA